VKHKVKDYSRKIRIGITEVLCACGELTRYKVPLLDLKDFVCPKKGK
jgi:hypothetical protein